jgi:hypothetical protein
MPLKGHSGSLENNHVLVFGGVSPNGELPNQERNNNSLATDFECVNASAVIVLDKWLPDDKIPSSQLVNGEVLASNPPVIA